MLFNTCEFDSYQAITTITKPISFYQVFGALPKILSNRKIIRAYRFCKNVITIRCAARSERFIKTNGGNFALWYIREACKSYNGWLLTLLEQTKVENIIWLFRVVSLFQHKLWLFFETNGVSTPTKIEFFSLFKICLMLHSIKFNM